MPATTFSGWENEKAVKESLEGAFSSQSLGAYDVQVRRHVVWAGGKYTEAPGEFETFISHRNVPGDAFHGILKSGPNQTVMMRSGEGFDLFRGDLLPIGETGMLGPSGKPADMGTEFQPYYTGVESFTRRLAAAFGNAAERSAEERQNGRTVNAEFYNINQQVTPAGGTGYRTPEGGKIIGYIPSSQVRVSAEESPTNIRYLANQYNAVILGDVQKSVEAMHRQVQTASPVRLAPGQPNTGMGVLAGGGIFEPSSTSGGAFIPRRALGDEYEVETAPGEYQTNVAGLTEKGIKQSYTAGRRQIGKFVVNTGNRLVELPEEYLTQASVTLRDNESDAPYSGIRMKTLTSVSPLPWQSGQMQVQLPEPIRKAIAGMTETPDWQAGITNEQRRAIGPTAAALEAGYYGRHKITLGGFQSIDQLINEKFQMNTALLGQKLEQGQQVALGTWEAPKDKQDAVRDLMMTTGQQNTAIRGYRLSLPYSWGDTEAKLRNLRPQLRKLEARGFSQIDFGATADPEISALLLSSAPGGWKGAAGKGSQNVPLLGVQQAMRRGGPDLAYDVLQEAKNVDAVMLNAMQALPTTGENNVYDYLRTLMPEHAETLNAYQQVRGARTINLQSLAGALGMPTGEHLIYQTTNRALQYDRGAPLAYDQMDQAFNERLIRQFGIGRARGVVPIEQYQADSIDELKGQMLTAMTAPMLNKDTGKLMPRMSQEAALKNWEENIAPNLEYTPIAGRGNMGLYTLNMPTETIVHPKLATLTPETSGVASDQGELLRAIQAQRLDEMANWLMEGGADSRYNQMFPERGARPALQSIVSSYLQNKFGGGFVDTQTNRIVGTEAGQINPQQVLDLAASLEGNDNQMTRIQNYKKVINRLAGVGEDEDVNLIFPKQNLQMAGPGAWLGVESTRNALAEEGGLEASSQAQISRKASGLLDRLFFAESQGITDASLIADVQDLQGRYVDSEQLRKRFGGGLFSRYAGSPLVRGGQAFVSQEWLRRNYLVGGGNPQSLREYYRYLNAAQGATAMGVRQPAPNIGTDEIPGSFFPVTLMTPQSRWGSLIQAAFHQGGTRGAEVVLPQSLTANLGDQDYDPASIFPMLVRTRNAKGRPVWERFQPGGNYADWMQEMARRMSPEQQRKTFEHIFGEGGLGYSPLDVNLRAASRALMGETGENLLNERLALNLTQTQKRVKEWNAVKQTEMGRTYNTLIRRVEASATGLGVPSAWIPKVRDPGVLGYQKAIDFEQTSSRWMDLMGTAGFQARGGQLEWGFMDKGKNGWDAVRWSPTGKDADQGLASAISGLVATTPNARPAWVAGMTMNVPAVPEGQTTEQTMQNLSDLQNAITARLEPVMQERPGEDELTRNMRITQEMAKLQKEGLVGPNSIASMSAMARSFEYAQADPERWRQISAAINQNGGFWWGGQQLNAENAAGLFRPFTHMYDYLTHRPDKTGWRGIPEMAETFLAAQKGKYASSEIIQQMWQNFGRHVGISNPALPQGLTVAGQGGVPEPIQSVRDIQQLKSTFDAQKEALSAAYFQGNAGGMRNMSFSSLGFESTVGAEYNATNSPDVLYNDQYRRMLSAGAMYGWRNPALAYGGSKINIRIPQQLVGSERSNAYFIQEGKATRAGDTAESVVTEAMSRDPEVARSLGMHIGQMENAPRYQVQGPSGGQYNIAGIPDFLKIQETTPGAFEVDVTDWKNLYAQHGKSAADIRADVRDNPAYAEQVPGYQTFYAQPEQIDAATRKFILGRASAEQKPIWQRYFASTAATRSAPVKARGRYLVSTQPHEATSEEMRGELEPALRAYARGEGQTAFTEVEMPEFEATPENITSRNAYLGGLAEDAQMASRTTALDAALYQRAVVKAYINERPELLQEMFGNRSQPLEFTQGELEARDKWLSARRTGETAYQGWGGWRFNPKREGEIGQVYNALSEQIGMLSSGGQVGGPNAQANAPLPPAQAGIPPTAPAGGGAPPQQPPPPPAGPAPVQEPNRRPLTATTPDWERTLSTLSTAVVQGLQNVMGQGSQQRPIFPGRRKMAPEVAAENFQKMGMLTRAMVGSFTPEGEFQPAEWTQNAVSQMVGEVMPYMPAELQPMIRQTLAENPNQALRMQETIGLERGIDLKKPLRRSPIARTVTGQTKVLSMLAGQLAPNLGQLANMPEIAAQFPGLENIIKALAGTYPEAASQLPGVAGTMGVMTEFIQSSSKAPTVPKKDEPLEPGGRERIGGWVKAFAEDMKLLEATSERMRRFSGQVITLDEALAKADKDSDRAKRVALNWDSYTQSQLRRNKIGNELRDEFGIGGQPNTPLSLAELQQASGRAATQGQGDKIAQYVRSAVAAQEAENNIVGIATGRGPQEPSIGRLARSMLGGFGMMYIGSIARMAATPTQYGYAEYNQLSQIAQAGTAAPFGGMLGSGMANPEQRIGRATAMYGGAGWAGLRGLAAGAVEKSPGAVGLANLGQAGLGAAGLMATIGMWSGSMATVAPWVAPVAMAAMGVAGGIETVGAATQDERNTVSILSQIRQGALTETGDFNLKGYLNPLNAFNFSQMGYRMNRALGGQQGQMVSRLQGLRAYEEGGGRDLRGYLAQQGLGQEQITSYMSLYNQAQMSSYPQYGEQALLQAQQWRDTYNLSTNIGGVNTFGALAGWAQAGMNIPQYAAAITGTTGMTFQQQRQAQAAYMEELAARQVGGKPLTEAEIQQGMTGAQRRAALGFLASEPQKASYAELLSARGMGQNAQEIYTQRLGNLSEENWQLMAQSADIQRQRAVMGLSYQAPEISAYENLTPAQRLQMTRNQMRQGMNVSQMQGIYQNLLGFGLEAPDMAPFDRMSYAERARIANQQSFGLNLMGSLQAGGLGQQQAAGIGMAFSYMAPQQFQQTQGLFSGNPLQTAAWALRNPQAWAQMPVTLPGMGGAEIPTAYLGMADIAESYGRNGYQQSLTGMQWGRSSLALPGISSAQMAQNIFGMGYQSRTNISQGLVGALVSGGMRGAEQWQQDLSNQYNQQMTGIQAQQIALQRAFQTGVGLSAYNPVNPQTGKPFGDLPSGGFWGLEDRSRALNWRQQEWSLDLQGRQQEMGNRFWQQNFSLNQRGTQMQRGWTREDWGFQDTTRALNWQWQVEDFNEEKRFLTGRERRVAERSMRRQTTMHNLEEEQIDTQRSRQQQLWKLEDERFRLELKQHQESAKLQDEGLKKQREFFEERKTLEEEQNKLSRAYWVEQMALQEQQTAASRQYAEIQKQIAQTMLEFNQFSEEATAKGKLFNEETMASLAQTLTDLDPLFASFVEQALKLYSGLSSGSEGATTQNLEPFVPGNALGGWMSVGDIARVNESETEVFRARQSGTVIPLGQLDPWSVASLPGAAPVQERGGPTTVVINIGGQHFKDIILDAVEKELDV